jgi:uncharacterized protein
MILLGEGTNRLRRYSDYDYGINLEKLLLESVEFLKELQQFDIEKAGSDVGENIALPLPQISIIKL